MTTAFNDLSNDMTGFHVKTVEYDIDWFEVYKSELPFT